MINKHSTGYDELDAETADWAIPVVVQLWVYKGNGFVTTNAPNAATFLIGLGHAVEEVVKRRMRDGDWTQFFMGLRNCVADILTQPGGQQRIMPREHALLVMMQDPKKPAVWNVAWAEQ